MMEQMSQELSIDNYTIRDVRKMFSDACQSHTFYNTYTLLDVEEAKKHVYLNMLRKYNYQHKEAIQVFIDKCAKMLINELFSNAGDKGGPGVNMNELSSTATAMVGYKNVIQDTRSMSDGCALNTMKEHYRIISIDSMYREQLWANNYVYDPTTATNMTVELNDGLDDVMSLELTNINIPFTFYNVDESYGNNYFYVETVGSNPSNITKVSVESGNYTETTLVNTINQALSALPDFSDLSIVLSPLSNKVTITNGNNTGTSYNIIFYDHLDTATKINNNLGWILGFRSMNMSNVTLEYAISPSSSITSDSLCYVPYTKYFVVVLDDYNKNQSNKGLVQVSHSKEFIKRTQYFKNVDNDLACLNNTNCDEFVNASDRQLTKKQIYSTLQINQYRNEFSGKTSTMDAQGVNNVFGIIPFETKSLEWGKSMITSDKNRFKRKYNGPVDISKMHIKLLDDKGNILNLNGCEWSMTLISTHVHQ
jgi:hypothetical protein